MYLFISKVITNGQELIVNQSSGELFYYKCDLRLKFVGFFPFKVLCICTTHIWDYLANGYSLCCHSAVTEKH